MSIVGQIKSDVEKFIVKKGKEVFIQKCMVELRTWIRGDSIFEYFKKFYPDILEKNNIDSPDSFRSIVTLHVLYSNDTLYGFNNGICVSIGRVQRNIQTQDIVSDEKGTMATDNYMVTFIGVYASKAANHFRRYIDIRDMRYNKRTDMDNIKINLYEDDFSGFHFKEKVHLNSVILDNNIKKEIIQFIDIFKNNVNKSYGLMLVGPSGTGKTSIIKAIASHAGLMINIFSGSKSVLQMKKQIMSFAYGGGGIYVLEDFDKLFEDMTSSDIGDLMQILDGLLTPKHSIFIITSNHPERFKEIPEMLRKGRIRTKLEINNFNENLANKFCKSKGLLDFEIPQFYQKYNITFPAQPSSLNSDVENYLFDKELAKY